MIYQGLNGSITPNRLKENLLGESFSLSPPLPNFLLLTTYHLLLTSYFLLLTSYFTLSLLLLLTTHVVSLSPRFLVFQVWWSRLRSTTIAIPAFFPLSPRLLVPLSHLTCLLVLNP